MSPRDTRTTFTNRWVKAPINNSLRLFRRFDLWDHNAITANIQGLLNPNFAVLGDSHEAWTPSRNCLDHSLYLKKI
jgi:hypothetical protein